ncbi:MAG: hypothetical protein LBH32_07575 [Dysgonamonadaceae bacterium]|jgi:prepilin signal peptidase PulO-like enzyme (type II secretory pathway)|nr:hypothetical protein [Dysgonamonadaceae bacterium]
MTWYEIVLIVSGILFIINAIGSLFFGNFDIDSDMDSGFLWGDILSFKGLLHFTIGFSLELTLMHEVTFFSTTMGVFVGIIFVVVLYFLYKWVYDKLQQNMKYTHEIKEMEAEVYFWDDKRKVGEVFVTLEGRPVTITLECPEEIHFEKGQKIKVSGTRQLVYPIDFII